MCERESVCVRERERERVRERERACVRERERACVGPLDPAGRCWTLIGQGGSDGHAL